MDKYKGIFYCSLASIFWGFSGVCGEYLLTYKNAVTAWAVPYRLLFAGIILVIFNFIKYKKQTVEIFIKRINIIDLLLTAFIGFLLSQLTYFYTIQYANAGIATILQYVAPIFILIFVCLTTKRFPKIYEIFAIIFSAVGVILISLFSNTDTFILPAKAIIIGLISALTVVAYNLLPIRLMRTYPPSIVSGWASLFAGIAAVIILKPYNYTDVIFDLGTLGAMCGVTVFGGAFAYTMYFAGVKHIGPQPASILASLEPISSVIIGFLWLKTTLTPLAVLGIALIIFAIISITFFKAKSEEKEKSKQ